MSPGLRGGLGGGDCGTGACGAGAVGPGWLWLYGPRGSGAPAVSSEKLLAACPLTIEPFARTPIEGVPEEDGRITKSARCKGVAANNSTADNISGRPVDRRRRLRFFFPRATCPSENQNSRVARDRNVRASLWLWDPRRREVLKHLVIRFSRAKTEGTLLVVPALPAARKIAFTMLAEKFLALLREGAAAEHSRQSVREECERVPREQ